MPDDLEHRFTGSQVAAMCRRIDDLNREAEKAAAQAKK